MLLRLAIVVALVATACSGDTATTTSAAPTTLTPKPTTTLVTLVDSRGGEIPPPPDVPTGPLSESAVEAVEVVWRSLDTNVDPEAIGAIGFTEDARLSWLLVDLVRFLQRTAVWRESVNAFNRLTGTDLGSLFADRPWNKMSDYLIAWDVPEPPGYVDYKRRLYTLVEPGWAPFFDDPNGELDWRLVTWGGVLIDNRELGDLEPCPRGCIPALDDPPATDATRGDWYPDDGIVFAVELNGEARAYPKNMMEVHEMVNDTIGGRRIGMPYCTLCGAAQAFLTDEVPGYPEPLVLRTSGLLSRSNKVMYDLSSKSVFDTFLGVALTGPLHDAGLVLEQVPVVTTTWGEWKTAYPETTIVVEDGGRDIDYPDDPLGGRDDDGPIFPVGDVDPRLPVQEQILGVISPDGSPLAFPVAAAKEALEAGDVVALGGVQLRLDGGGVAANAGGQEIASHQAFWFAWSQFYSDSLLWEP
ncbi:MAG: DUF3179 domain-containing (seleno)protein [Acidimicrobiia bacterium]|nr:DUF3179 domain-containing (seleno)protein [Acidimicrobiia bacterium]